MREQIFIVETSSAHMRDLLRQACSSIMAARVFASAQSAKTAIAEEPPAYLVVGGAPLDDAVLELMREACHRHAVVALACVHANELLRAQRHGALDGYARDAAGIEALAKRLRSTALASRTISRPAGVAYVSSPSLSEPTSTQPRPHGAAHPTPCRLIAIGASTGGPDAIAALLAQLPTHLPGIVIVQHMPGSHTPAFAQRLSNETRWHVREARDGDKIESGGALVAPGGFHMRVQLAGFVVRLSREPAQLTHIPSVDVLFESVARELAEQALGVLLTGMGSDGARGLLAMRRAGAHTIAQDEASCAVYGMPKRAADLGAVLESAGLDELPRLITARASPLALERLSVQPAAHAPK